MASNSDNHENMESKDDGQQIEMVSSNDELQDEQKPKKKRFIKELKRGRQFKSRIGLQRR